MKTTKTIPFDWDFYQVNKDKCRVITREKLPSLVTEVVRLNSLKNQQLVGVVNGDCYRWNIDGTYRYSGHGFSERDLRLEVIEEALESWIAILEHEETGKRKLS